METRAEQMKNLFQSSQYFLEGSTHSAPENKIRVEPLLHTSPDSFVDFKETLVKITPLRRKVLAHVPESH